MFKFEKLKVWQRAIEYADTIYRLTETFPDTEKFGLTSQLRRSAVSVSANLAEGCSRSSMADWARFIEIAYGSLLESVSELNIAMRQGFLTKESCEQACNHAVPLAKMLSALRRNVKSGERRAEGGERRA